MRQSQQDLDNGNHKSFESMEDAIKDLEELANASHNQDK